MTTGDIDVIRAQTGATALLSLQSDACRAVFGIDYQAHRAYGEQNELVMVNAPMLDFDPPDQRRNLPHAVRSLRDLLAADHKVYLHCTAGCNRAPLTALGYLSFVEMLMPGRGDRIHPRRPAGSRTVVGGLRRLPGRTWSR